MQQQFSDRIADSHINGDHIKKKQKRKTGTLNNIYVAGRWGGEGVFKTKLFNPSLRARRTVMY